MKTQLLFYNQPYETNFTAEVKAVEPVKKGFRAALDRTLFYPEGGGQPADKGTIAGIPVFHVEKKEGTVWHHLADRPPEGTVEGRIEWAHRFDYMQQHTGQHILSAVMYRDFSFNTLAVHQGTETTTIEIDTGELEDSVIEAIESASMEIVGRNLPVEAQHVEEGRIDEYDLRREPKVSGLIRLVSLGEYDAVACGGLHTSTSGEVKLLKHVQTEKIRGNIRLHWKIGDRAMRDYALKHGIVSSLVERFSAQAPDLLERIYASLEDLTASRRRVNMLEGRIAAETARRLFDEATRLKKAENSRVVATGEFEGEGKDFLKKLSEGMPEESPWALAAVNRQGDSFQWLIAVSRESSFDFNAVKGELLSLIDGKGGGRPPLWQGIGTGAGGITLFFEKFREILDPTD